MKIELNEDELTLIVRALFHYYAYVVSQQRTDLRYMALAERLKRDGGEARKPPALESAQHSRSRARR
jgi:hypothetical protein